jgi:hypothetical protein
VDATFSSEALFGASETKRPDRQRPAPACAGDCKMATGEDFFKGQTSHVLSRQEKETLAPHGAHGRAS